MRVTRENNRLAIAVNLFERRLLLRIFRALIENYKIKPDQIDPKAAEVWYSTRGCAKAKMSPEETRDWVENLYQFKTARLRLIERCARELSARKDERAPLQLTIGEAPELMTALNDHRLLLAARHDIGQTEMDMRRLSDVEKLKPAQHAALFEIDFLGYFIEEILHAVSPQAANWMREQDG